MGRSATGPQGAVCPSPKLRLPGPLGAFVLRGGGTLVHRRAGVVHVWSPPGSGSGTPRLPKGVTKGDCTYLGGTGRRRVPRKPDFSSAASFVLVLTVTIAAVW